MRKCRPAKRDLTRVDKGSATHLAPLEQLRQKIPRAQHCNLLACLGRQERRDQVEALDRRPVELNVRVRCGRGIGFMKKVTKDQQKLDAQMLRSDEELSSSWTRSNRAGKTTTCEVTGSTFGHEGQKAGGQKPKDQPVLESIHKQHSPSQPGQDCKHKTRKGRSPGRVDDEGLLHELREIRAPHPGHGLHNACPSPQQSAHVDQHGLNDGLVMNGNLERIAKSIHHDGVQ